MPVSAHDEASYEIVPGDPTSPIVLHVPHAATRIPAEVRNGIRLDNEALGRELERMTDADTDLLAGRACGLAVADGCSRPWLMVNRLSRLVVDPERFPDERELLNDRGMGTVYTHTSHREPLRKDDAVHRRELIDRYFAPYAKAMTDLIDERLRSAGGAVILDIHSYPVEALPFELYPQARRPEVCLGVDDSHTPGWLLDSAISAFAGWDVAVNEPFIGCYVPLKHYERDRRVCSLMLEIRRDILRTAGLDALARSVAAVVEAVDVRDDPFGEAEARAVG